jgi:putative sterol carrier protein
VVIRDRTIQVRPGLDGTADLTVRADGRSWMRFLAKERGLLGSLLRRKIRLRGDPRLLLAFGRCFPS